MLSKRGFVTSLCRKLRFCFWPAWGGSLLFLFRASRPEKAKRQQHHRQ